jgi:hypothetical protein
MRVQIPLRSRIGLLFPETEDHILGGDAALALDRENIGLAVGGA